MKMLSKKITVLTLIFSLFSGFSLVHAQDSGQQAYEQALVKQASEAMQQLKEESTVNLEMLKERIQNIPRNDERRQQAFELIKVAEEEVEAFQGVSTQPQITPGIGNSPPLVEFNTEFASQYKKVEDAFLSVNQILLGPARPGEVPEGDVVEDFIPNLVRQFFRFAWVAVFISFVVSGVMFVMGMGNDERIDKAKKMLYFSLIGFAFIALSFALVQAITDIDFFRFI